MLTIEMDHTMCNSCGVREARERYLSCEICGDHAAAIILDKARLRQSAMYKQTQTEPQSVKNILDELLDLG